MAALVVVAGLLPAGLFLCCWYQLLPVAVCGCSGGSCRFALLQAFVFGPCSLLLLVQVLQVSWSMGACSLLSTLLCYFGCLLVLGSLFPWTSLFVYDGFFVQQASLAFGLIKGVCSRFMSIYLYCWSSACSFLSIKFLHLIKKKKLIIEKERRSPRMSVSSNLFSHN